MTSGETERLVRRQTTEVGFSIFNGMIAFGEEAGEVVDTTVEKRGHGVADEAGETRKQRRTRSAA